MGKKQSQGKDMSAVAAADKAKSRKNDNKKKLDAGGVSGPVAVKKVRSFQGKHELGLYAARARGTKNPRQASIACSRVRSTVLLRAVVRAVAVRC
jgi:hypothetical protein